MRQKLNTHSRMPGAAFPTGRPHPTAEANHPLHFQATKRITPNPLVGFDLSKAHKDICAQTVDGAAVAGDRHFDSARDYGNDEEVRDRIPLP